MHLVIMFITTLVVPSVTAVAAGFVAKASFKSICWKRRRRLEHRLPTFIKSGTNIDSYSSDHVRFISPLLEYGYRPTVEQYKNNTLSEKPLLLYLPGFDGTFLSPFLQFPELDTIFDVRCMVVPMKNRSNLDALIETVVEYLRCEVRLDRKETELFENQSDTSITRMQHQQRPVYITGESFGGILTLLTTLVIKDDPSINLQGLVLINPATCYERSKLAVEAPKVAALPSWLYIFGLLKLLPLFTDEYSLGQLLLILKADALPSVIDNEVREAYMGRVAFSLPFVLPFMDQEALRFRLTEWLESGCNRITTSGDSLSQLQNFRYLIVAGEKDGTLPAVAEAERLAALLPDTICHIVDGAGHASTCGSRVDLAALCRLRFPELRRSDANDRTSLKEGAAKGEGIWLGMEPRYDNAKIGLSPLKYWDDKYYCQVK